MSLVGDIILELRQRIPDMPGVGNPPEIVKATQQFIPGGGPPFTTPQSYAVTSVNLWGETGLAPGQVITLPVDGVSNATILEVGSSPPPNYYTNNIYQAGDYTPGGSPNALFDKWSFPILTGDDTYTIGGPNFPLPTLSNPPLRYTSFHPDTDGNFIGAYTAFRLLNRAIQEMVKIAGGIVDVTGVQTSINQSMYRLDSPFYTFTNA